jgi:sn-glycerol 3-phosphate transport system substrate-binding protein
VKLALRFLQLTALAAIVLVSPAQAATEIAWWHAMSG